MLGWAYFFSLLIITVFLSLGWANRSLLHLLFLTEIVTMLLFCINLTLSIFYNLYIYICLALILLIMGGLELALAFLIVI